VPDKRRGFCRAGIMTPTHAMSAGTELSSAGQAPLRHLCDPCDFPPPAAAPATSVDRFQRLLESAGEPTQAPMQDSRKGDDLAADSESVAAAFQNVNAWAGTFQASQPLVASPPPVATAILRELAPHLCSAAYVASSSSKDHSHLLIALDGAIAGASAEFVRAGAFLQVRLHARSDAAYRLMSAQRAALSSAVAAVTPLSVSVEVVYDTGEDHGSTA
jgi:hypothetical protein